MFNMQNNSELQAWITRMGIGSGASFQALSLLREIPFKLALGDVSERQKRLSESKEKK